MEIVIASLAVVALGLVVFLLSACVVSARANRQMGQK